MKSIILLVGLCFLGIMGYGQPGSGKLAGANGAIGFDPPGANDHIFPAAVAARPFIDFDAKGFLVNGKRSFLVSAGMEYARIPHELWQDRLLRLRRAGFNCIEIYTFWNFHEPQEGKFDFSGDHDLEAFLRLVKKMGLYAIVRVGPYYCAEWDDGGYPLWLRFKPGLRVREDNAVFEKYVDRFFDRLLPIVSREQIHHGGAVILVQLENEHPKGWGTIIPDGYFRHLRDKALSLGLEVPYFFSGLHHASDPAAEDVAAQKAAGAGDAESLDDPSRPNPWMSTEFWSVWYSGYGSTVKDALVYERRTWKIIAHGGNGYNYYMAHGGSNFGYTNNDEDAASYDYGAAVGQAGDLRPIYYSFKRMGWWARSFSAVLENSRDATAEWRGIVTDTAIHISARHSPAGDLIFLDNPSTVAKTVSLVGRKRNGEKLSSGGKLVLVPGEIFPVVHHFVMDSLLTLEWASVRLLGISGQGPVTTMVVYGEPGASAELYFSVRGRATIVKGGEGLSVKADGKKGGEASVTAGGKDFSRELTKVVLQTKFSDSHTPVEYSFMAGGKKWRVLVVNRQLADRTWLEDVGGHRYIVCGPDYVDDIHVQQFKVLVRAELPWRGGGEYPVWVYGDQAAPLLLKTTVRNADVDSVGRENRLSLTPWEFHTAAGPAAPGYADEDWKYSEEPVQMGADGDGTAEAWYRTKLSVAEEGRYILQVDGGDRATAFVDGRPAGSGDIRDGEISFILSKGQHSLAFFTTHDGRDKLAAYLGSMDSVDRKGIFGNAILRKGGPSIVTLGGWHFLKASSDAALPASGMAGWKDYTIGDDAFDHKEGRGWFRTVLADPGASVKQIVLKFRSVDENATVFINGRKVGRHEGWNQPFEVVLDGLDTVQRPLELTLLVENYSNEGGIDRPVRANYAGPGMGVTGWHMRGGAGDPAGIGDWKLLPVGGTEGEGRAGMTDTVDVSGKTASAGPYWYRSEFIIPGYGVSGPHPIWRVHTEGLGHGSVWVNGHNLGRYPEKTSAPGLYVPECWLKAGRNTLIILDDDGKGPGDVSVQAEVAAGRDLAVFSNF